MVPGGFEICFMFVFLFSSVCFRNVWVLACAGARKKKKKEAEDVLQVGFGATCGGSMSSVVLEILLRDT